MLSSDLDFFIEDVNFSIKHHEKNFNVYSSDLIERLKAAVDLINEIRIEIVESKIEAKIEPKIFKLK